MVNADADQDSTAGLRVRACPFPGGAGLVANQAYEKQVVLETKGNVLKRVHAVLMIPKRVLRSVSPRLHQWDFTEPPSPQSKLLLNSLQSKVLARFLVICALPQTSCPE